MDKCYQEEKKKTLVADKLISDLMRMNPQQKCHQVMKNPSISSVKTKSHLHMHQRWIYCPTSLCDKIAKRKASQPRGARASIHCFILFHPPTFLYILAFLFPSPSFISKPFSFLGNSSVSAKNSQSWTSSPCQNESKESHFISLLHSLLPKTSMSFPGHATS